MGGSSIDPLNLIRIMPAKGRRHFPSSVGSVSFIGRVADTQVLQPVSRPGKPEWRIL
jgi:hypothetical protein